MNTKQKIGFGALVALAMIVTAVPLSSANVIPVSASAGGVSVGCGPAEQIGYGGTATSRPNGAHVSYVTTFGALVVGQDGCLDNAVQDTNSFFFSGGADDGLGVSGTFLYGRVGTAASITDGTTHAPSGSAGCTAGVGANNDGPCTYTGQGSGLVCMSPLATAHHGPDTKIFVQDAVLGGSVGFSVAEDWARSTGNAPVQDTTPPDALPAAVRAIIASIPVVGPLVLTIYDNQIRPQPTPITPGPGNTPAADGGGACGDGTIEPCPAGVDENVIGANNPSGCNELDHIWVQNNPTPCIQTGLSFDLTQIVSDAGAGNVVALAADLTAFVTGQVVPEVSALPANLVATVGHIAGGCLLSPTPNTFAVSSAGTVNGNTATNIASISGASGDVAVFINDPATQVSIWTGN